VTIPVTMAPAVAPPPSPDAARGDVDSSSETSITWSEVRRQNVEDAAVVAVSHGHGEAAEVAEHLDRAFSYHLVRSTSRPSSRSRSPLRIGHDDA
jgi:hypothetical protein